MQKLQLNGCQGYMALKYHMEEAFIEKKLDPINTTCAPPIALFSQKYYNEINELNHNKIYDFCFIGSIKSCFVRRKWVIDFAKKYFTSNSIFINTDNDPKWQLLGSYDHSNRKLGFCPKNQPDVQSKNTQYRTIKDNIYYFETMCQSRFTLCPAGDSPWSFRFYEVLMCKSIPVVETWHHTYRTKEEATIKYKFVLSNNWNTEIVNDNSVYDEYVYDEYVNENSKLFEKNHILN